MRGVPIAVSMKAERRHFWGVKGSEGKTTALSRRGSQGAGVSASQVLFGQTLLDQVAVARRRHALELLEAAVEVGEIVEA